MTENKSVEWPYLLPSSPQMSEKVLREQAERIWETHKEVFFRLSFTQASMVARALLTATGHTSWQTDFVQFLIEAKLRDNVPPILACIILAVIAVWLAGHGYLIVAYVAALWAVVAMR